MVTKYNEYQTHRENVPQVAVSGLSVTAAADSETTTGVSPAEILKEQKKVICPTFIYFKIYQQKRARMEHMIAGAVSDLRGGLFPSHVFRLTSAGSITLDDAVSPTELKRRQKMRRLHIRPVVKINGKILASTGPLPLQWPALKIEVNRAFGSVLLCEFQ